MHKPQFDGTPSTEEYRAYLALLLRDTFIGRAENLPRRVLPTASLRRMCWPDLMYRVSITPRWMVTP